MVKLISLSGMSHLFSYSLLMANRMLGIMSSIFYAKKFQTILDELKTFDESLRELFGIEINSAKRFFKLSAKMILLVVFDLIVLMGNYFVLQNEKPKGFWMLTATTIHVIHLKDLSFIFFMDLFNCRLSSLVTVEAESEKEKVLKLHTKLFDISKLINDCHSGVMTFSMIQHCFSFVSNFFWLFMSLAKLEFFVGIYRKLFNCLIGEKKLNLCRKHQRGCFSLHIYFSGLSIRSRNNQTQPTSWCEFSEL